MTRKDFEALAGIVKSSVKIVERRYWLAIQLAQFCAAQNTRFDHVRFFEACGVPNLWLKK